MTTEKEFDINFMPQIPGVGIRGCVPPVWEEDGLGGVESRGALGKRDRSVRVCVTGCDMRDPPDASTKSSVGGPFLPSAEEKAIIPSSHRRHLH